MKQLIAFFAFLVTLTASSQALSYGWYGPIWPESQTIDVQFTQSGNLLVKLNDAPNPVWFTPSGGSPTQFLQLVGAGTIRITVTGLNPGLSAVNEIDVELWDNNFQQKIGEFELDGCSIGCPQVYVFDQADMYFTQDPINPSNLFVDKPVYASGYGNTQIDFRENRVYYRVTEPDGDVMNFPYQVSDPLFSSYEEMHFPFWAFETGNYSICAWYNHADVGLPSHFSETNIIPDLCLGFWHNGLSTSLNESNFEELGKNGLFVWPNPVSEVFKMTSVQSGQYIVMNSVGQTIQAGKLIMGDNTLDASSWPTGVYIISVLDTGYFTKVIRQ